ncbi:FAD-dependent oxidoreductase [Roseomonas sp. PWR1]|uniref:FAD-dependent oxidoreductase n=1 Tax=Roseomonas nitratireducens TaxID=2820810 RepID=A0ABS4AMS6_9PROT|nr:FAD-dependent oxidoreductase [Neoroseomonas nitratireducens]MBP0462665.1 FAD-dependent oxidoreductase [Neoroseomonas nitratireducens]
MASSPTALVLGAGIMGLSAAWGLARQGYAVRVLDQDPVPNPRGASVDHHRLIRHAYGAQAGYMRMVDPAYAAWDMLWRDLGEVLHVTTGVLAVSGGTAGWLGDSRAALAADGRAFQDLSPAEIPARYPMLTQAGIGAAFHMAPGGVLLAERIVAGLARHLAARGVAFARARAVDVMPEAGALRLADGSVESADLLVLAAGPWGPRLLPAALAPRVVASRQILVRLEPPARHAEAWARAPMLLDLAEEGGFYAVPPVAGTPLKIGDHRFSRTGDAEADPREATPAEAEEILAFARPRIRDLGEYRILGARACYYDVEDGERFVVEPLGGRAFVMSGFTGHGFKFAPLLGLGLAAAARDPALTTNLVPWAAGEAPPAPGLLAAIESIPA